MTIIVIEPKQKQGGFSYFWSKIVISWTLTLESLGRLFPVGSGKYGEYSHVLGQPTLWGHRNGAIVVQWGLEGVLSHGWEHLGISIRKPHSFIHSLISASELGMYTPMFYNSRPQRMEDLVVAWQGNLERRAGQWCSWGRLWRRVDIHTESSEWVLWGKYWMGT